MLGKQTWGSGLLIGFIGLLQTVITVNYNCFTDSRSLQMATAHTKSSWSAVSSPVSVC
jgi:hypothetical protein